MENRDPFQSDLIGIAPSTSGEMHALFFALFPDANARKALDDVAAMLESKHRASGRGIKPHRRHMTLHFIDQYSLRPDDVIERLKRVGREVVARAFDMQLDVVGSFPNGDKPWWIGTRAVSEELDALHKAIVEGECRSRGKLPARSTFVPHVTLFRQNLQALESYSVDPVRWRVDSFCLIDSVLGSKPQHVVIEKWALPGK
jgi:2'-5' RNA ligase